MIIALVNQAVKAYTVLEKFTIDQVAMAAMKIIKTHKYNSLPTVADMINAIEPGQGDCAEIGAGKVLEYLHFFGTSVTPSFRDPITKHLMTRRWWWYAWASGVQESELKWWTREFIRAYTAQTAMVDAGACIPARLPIGRLVQTI